MKTNIGTQPTPRGKPTQNIVNSDKQAKENTQEKAEGKGRRESRRESRGEDRGEGGLPLLEDEQEDRRQGREGEGVFLGAFKKGFPCIDASGGASSIACRLGA